MSLDFLIPENDPDLVYRIAPHMDSLVFTSPGMALEIDQIHEALSATTWCEFAYLMPSDELNEMIIERNSPEEEWLKDDLFMIPGPAAAVDLEQLCPQYYDGDYPEWLQKQQELWLPEDILEQWGRRDSSAINGTFWFIETQHEEKILEELGKRGLKVEKRDDLFFY